MEGKQTVLPWVFSSAALAKLKIIINNKGDTEIGEAGCIPEPNEIYVCA